MPSLSKDCPKRRAESDPEGEPPIKKLELLHLGPTAFPDKEEPTNHNELTVSDSMFLDDTPHTSYIYDIERELASIEEQEKQISFLPEVERRLNAIPKSILKDPKPDNELVLYRVPHSLTVSEDQDSVRRAIIESRARVRAQQADAATVESASDITKGSPVFAVEADDCMDIDPQQ